MEPWSPTSTWCTGANHHDRFFFKKIWSIGIARETGKIYARQSLCSRWRPTKTFCNCFQNDVICARDRLLCLYFFFIDLQSLLRVVLWRYLFVVRMLFEYCNIQHSWKNREGRANRLRSHLDAANLFKILTMLHCLDLFFILSSGDIHYCLSYQKNVGLPWCPELFMSVFSFLSISFWISASL